MADDEEELCFPRWVNEGLIIKIETKTVFLDTISIQNLRGYKTTIEGLSHKFNPEFWNYAETDFRNFKTRNAN